MDHGNPTRDRDYTLQIQGDFFDFRCITAPSDTVVPYDSQRLSYATSSYKCSQAWSRYMYCGHRIGT